MVDHQIRQIVLDKINEDFVLGGPYSLSIDENKLKEVVKTVKTTISDIINHKSYEALFGQFSLFERVKIQTMIHQVVVSKCDIQGGLTIDKYDPSVGIDEKINRPGKRESSKSTKMILKKRVIPRLIDVIDEFILEETEDNILTISIFFNESLMYVLTVVESRVRIEPPIVLPALAYTTVRIEITHKDGTVYDGKVIHGGRNLMEVFRERLVREKFDVKNDKHVFTYELGALTRNNTSTDRTHISHK